MTSSRNSLRVGIVTPHIFLHRDILPHVIFSPGRLAIDLAQGVQALGADVTLFSPGPIDTTVRNISADLTYFKQELAGRGDTYLDLLKKHPFTFVTLARQVQAEIIAKAYAMANAGELDIVHIYTNEEDTALPFAELCKKPVVFTHHDPFNFLVKYKNVFPKYKQLNWISMSLAQRAGMPAGTNWVANIYHGLPPEQFTPVSAPTNGYVAYLGRAIEPKGLHLAIAAAKKAGVKLKIAGKHYTGYKDTYWQQKIAPELCESVEYVGFIRDDAAKRAFLGNAKALIVPSTYNEPFGMVTIEALACGTPVIGVNAGAASELIDTSVGFLIDKNPSEDVVVNDLAKSIINIGVVDRAACRKLFEQRFTLARMCHEHLQLYKKLSATKQQDQS